MSLEFARIKSALADRYSVERELGRGGMAVVYLADDLKHHRKVSIKVLLPEVAASLGSERFLREIEIAARLNHPHILTLIDSGEADGLLYYVMPFVDGESLRERLYREGSLPVDDSLRLAREIADGLEHAHANDVVHRDIKPENVLLSGDHAVIADFGIARAITEAHGERVTRTGVSIGSPIYMSPEQAGGEDRIDGRADIYALGCVLYEMLAGEPPFTGRTSAAVMARKTVDTAPNLRAMRETVPPAVEQAVGKALARAPADRFSTAAEFANALSTPTHLVARRRRLSRAVLVAIVVLTIAATGWLLRPGYRTAPGSGADLRSIGVLPLENRSVEGGEDAAFFTAGVHDNILTQLSKIDSLKVISRTSVAQYEGTTKTTGQIADELGVATLLEGSVQRSGDRVQINVQLIDAEADRQLWAETYDEALTAGNVFAIQSDVAKKIASGLRATLSPEVEARIAARPTKDLEAFDLYTRGRYFWNKRTREGFETAIEYFRQALEHDSSYAAAHAGIADSYVLLAEYNHMRRDEALPLARTAAERALALDESLAEAHVALGHVHHSRGDWEAAESSYRRAIELNPNYATAHQWYGNLLWRVGRSEEALEEARRAHELDPLSGIISAALSGRLLRNRQYLESLLQADRTIELLPDFAPGHRVRYSALERLGQLDEALVSARRAAEADPSYGFVPPYIHYFRGEYETAVDELYRLIELRPLDIWAWWGLAWAQAASGRYDQAITAWERANDLDPEYPFNPVGIAYTLAAAGRTDEARAILADMERLRDDPRRPSALTFMARAYGALGDTDRAFELLDEALEKNVQWWGVKSDPAFDPLRGDPRFDALLERLGLDAASIDSIMARYRSAATP